jgi:hypothetical protein
MPDNGPGHEPPAGLVPPAVGELPAHLRAVDPMTRAPVRAVAVFLILGGLAGIVTVVWEMSGITDGGGVQITLTPVGGLPFVLATLAGALLLAATRAGLILSLLVLALQSFGWRFGDLEVAYSTGGKLCVGMNTDLSLLFQASVGSGLSVFWEPRPGAGYLTVNVVAVGCLAILWQWVGPRGLSRGLLRRP